MDFEAVIGCTIVAAALAILVTLVIWSRRTINRIAESDLKSVRDIVRDLENGS